MENTLTKFYMFVRPSFAEGMGRVLDLSGSLKLYNPHKSPRQKDYDALKKDWEAVGNDLRTSITKYERAKQIT